MVVVAVVLLAAGLLLGLPVLRGLGGFALAAFAVAMFPRLVRLRPTVGRTVAPTRLERGRSATARLVISNDRNQRQPAFVARDRVGDTVVEIDVPALAPGGSSEHRYDIPTRRRGRIEIGPLAVERSDPLGLARSRVDIADLTAIWVQPRRYPVRVADGGRLRHHHEGPVTDRPMRGSTDLRSLREYVPGDELRHVHARASARIGTLVVRELVDPVQPHCTVMLDNRSEALSADAFEEAVEVAASIAWSAAAAGQRVVLCTAEGDVLRGGERLESVEPVLDRLASVDQVASADIAGALEVVAHGRGGWLVVATGAADRAVLSRLTGLRGFDPITVFDVSGWPESPAASGLMIVRGSSARAAIDHWNRISGA
jgi:uncharacterized protein (DUF58 family)